MTEQNLPKCDVAIGPQPYPTHLALTRRHYHVHRATLRVRLREKRVLQLPDNESGMSREQPLGQFPLRALGRQPSRGCGSRLYIEPRLCWLTACPRRHRARPVRAEVGLTLPGNLAWLSPPGRATLHRWSSDAVCSDGQRRRDAGAQHREPAKAQRCEPAKAQHREPEKAQRCEQPSSPVLSLLQPPTVFSRGRALTVFTYLAHRNVHHAAGVSALTARRATPVD